VTDRQTDGQTDRRTEFSSLDRVYIPCSAVKIKKRRTEKEEERRENGRGKQKGGADRKRGEAYVMYVI